MSSDSHNSSESSVKMNGPMSDAENHSSADSSRLQIEIEDDSKPTKSDIVAKPAARKEFECGVCSLVFQSFESLDDHYVGMHNHRVEHVCPKCNSGFHILQDYFEHKSSHEKKHVEEKIVDDEEEEEEMAKEEESEPKKDEMKKRKASISIKPFKKQKLEKSITERVEDLSKFSSKTYKCDDCAIPEMGCEAYFDHCKNEHGRVPCLECGQTFAQKSFLERHNWKHLGVKPFPCDECDKAFTRKHALDQHKSKHHSKADS